MIEGTTTKTGEPEMADKERILGGLIRDPVETIHLKLIKDIWLSIGVYSTVGRPHQRGAFLGFLPKLMKKQ